jgi:hypothetical protein
MVATKTCSACGETKPLIEFFKRKRGKDGYNSQCKLCVAKMPGQREADRERAAQWRRDNPERHQANTRAYRERNPERHVARNAVYFAVKRGELVRQPCEGCGNPGTDARHDDYSKRLEVWWLCATHYAEADIERRWGEAKGR